MARLAFFGTPEFAVPSLEALLEAEGHDVVLVVCQPDRPKGRGKAVLPPPVKERAQAAGVLVLQPATLKKGTDAGDAFFDAFAEANVDLAVVAAYGRILPRRLLALPRRGFVNVHASLLPRWRGAAPIQRAIEAGDAETGVCLMDMVFELDAGDVYAAHPLPIAPDDDGETLTHKLAQLGKQALHDALPRLLAGELGKTPQPEEGVTYAHMLRKEEGEVRWDLPAQRVADHARAMHPWPGACARWQGDALKLFRPAALTEAEAEVFWRGAGLGEAPPPGTILACTPALVVACATGAVSFGEGQLPGKRRMTFAELACGCRLTTGMRLGA